MNKTSCLSLAVQCEGASAVLVWEAMTEELTAACLGRAIYNLETD